MTHLMKDSKNCPIIITGFPRSLTSMTAGLLYHHGVPFGRIGKATRYNRKGFFENLVLRDTVVKTYLMGIPSDPLGQWPLPPDVEYLPKFDKFRSIVERILKTQGVDVQSQWGWKCVKLPLMWPIVHEHFPEAKWVIVRRDIEDIIQSCAHTSFMKKLRNIHIMDQWVDHYLECIQTLNESDADTTEIWAPDIIEGDTTELQKLIEELGLTYDPKVVADFVDPSLCHYHSPTS